MKFKQLETVCALSILLSPLAGGLIGRILVGMDVLYLSNGYADDALVFVCIAAWALATLFFYRTHKE